MLGLKPIIDTKLYNKFIEMWEDTKSMPCAENNDSCRIIKARIFNCYDICPIKYEKLTKSIDLKNCECHLLWDSDCTQISLFVMKDDVDIINISIRGQENEK